MHPLLLSSLRTFGFKGDLLISIIEGGKWGFWTTDENK